ncbi:translesion DNA synthesis-associated protein ImuA [Undibacterium pigrum]|uniref:translesion DNA synthesis-associated protein ImuA n=1 Tax=Undibacterium pigrum TaxID=401470 RepID=UPI000D7528B8|nr:translesion DNA synthesis-associated protein ImuA [Undibacterium pigrum]
MSAASSSSISSVIGKMPHAIWRANEIAVYKASTTSSGFDDLDAELPNAGWPRSSLIELLLVQAGIGELQLLKPVLAEIAKTQRIAFIHPPHIPNGLAFQRWELADDRLFWMKCSSTADALWTTEQVLKNGCFGAVMLWQTNIRAEALRRLNLAAQTTDTCFFLLRPLAAQRDTSPAPLRLVLRPARGGVNVEIIKRRGPHSDKSLYLTLPDMPISKHLPDHNNAHVDQPMPSISAARSTQTLLV